MSPKNNQVVYHSKKTQLYATIKGLSCMSFYNDSVVCYSKRTQLYVILQ